MFRCRVYATMSMSVSELICEPSHFKRLNQQAEIEKHSGPCSSVGSIEDIYYPAFNPRNRQCYLQQQPMLFRLVCLLLTVGWGGSGEYRGHLLPCLQPQKQAVLPTAATHALQVRTQPWHKKHGFAQGRGAGELGLGVLPCGPAYEEGGFGNKNHQLYQI